MMKAREALKMLRESYDGIDINLPGILPDADFSDVAGQMLPAALACDIAWYMDILANMNLVYSPANPYFVWSNAMTFQIPADDPEDDPVDVNVSILFPVEETLGYNTDDPDFKSTAARLIYKFVDPCSFVLPVVVTFEAGGK